MIKYAIFDLDGTLLDSSEMWQNLGSRYLELHGIASQDDLSSMMKTMAMAESAKFLRDKYSLSYSADEIVRQFSRMIEDYYLQQVSFRSGAPRLLAYLNSRCVKMSIATAGDSSLGMAALRRLGVADFFAGAVSCAEFGAKTSAEIFYAAADLIHALPEQTLVVEDSLHAVRTAKKAGFKTASVRDISERNQDELKRISDFYADSPGELAELLAESK